MVFIRECNSITLVKKTFLPCATELIKKESLTRKELLAVFGEVCSSSMS